MTISQGSDLEWMGVKNDIVYMSYRRDGGTHRRRSFDGGATWEGESWWGAVDPGGAYCHAALGDGGRIHVLQCRFSGRPLVYYRSTDAGNSWIDSSVVVSDSGAFDRDVLGIALSQGDVHALWSHYDYGNTELFYRRGVGLAGLAEDGSPPAEPKASIELSASSNPFRCRVTVRFVLPCDADVSISIRDASGRLVWSQPKTRKTAGISRLFWNGRDGTGQPVRSGCYFVTLEAGVLSARAKLVKS
jgi:hypothetical protein